VLALQITGADPDFYVRGERDALLGEGSGARLGPHRVQGSARWGDRRGEAPRSSWELENIGPLF